MCGRYTLALDPEQLMERYGLSQIDIDFPPRYNVAPSQDNPILLSETNSRVLKLARWGLVPSWIKDKKGGYRLINARAETVVEKPTFKRLLRQQRCIVPADGYFEWRKIPGLKQKTPMRFVRKDGRLFSFAGLWDWWQSPDGEDLQAYTIITTEANSISEPIHNRMPAILRREDEGRWLDSDDSDADSLAALLSPYPSEEMEVYEVSRLVNSPANDSPECIVKVG
jgi:putative SOS response-associated peptidase YedK